MVVTEADDRMPESRRLRQHSTPAMEHRRMSVLRRIFFSKEVSTSFPIPFPFSFPSFSPMVVWTLTGISPAWSFFAMLSGFGEDILMMIFPGK